MSSSPIRSVARAASWPIRRFFDPRFSAGQSQTIQTDQRLHAKLDQVIDEVRGASARLDPQFDGTRQALGGTLEVVQEMSVHVGAELERMSRAVLDLEEGVRGPATARAAGVEALGPHLADFLNFAQSHQGFSAERGLWLNPAVNVEYRPGDVVVGSVNERIVEVPYVLAAVADLPTGSRILDLGASESTVSLSLASLGHHVTALDLRPYPFTHPLLESVAMPFEDWPDPEDPFDAIISLSTIEHFGVGAYGDAEGDPDADIRAIERLRSVTRTGGRLVLTAPFGVASRDEIQRVYDRAGIERLLASWNVEEIRVVEQIDATTWRPPLRDTDEAPAEGARQVVLVRASASDTER